MALGDLKPDAALLAAGVCLDLLLGDPVYPLHPVRLMGRTLSAFENILRRIGLDGYTGGILLFLLLTATWCGGVVLLLRYVSGMAAALLHVFLVYSLVALRDLLRHGFAVDRAASQGDLAGARKAISMLVGRDTDFMDGEACRRAAIESLSENLTDGFISPIFWYAIAGLPGLLVFKVVSTMDSMVGYRTPRYLRFGWCGARTDDLLNLIPARLTWLLLSAVASFVPGCSPRKAFRTGWEQHAVVPGPNSGWSEATVAGALQRKLIGPIYAGGKQVTEVWLGDPPDVPAGSHSDFRRAVALVTATGVVATLFTLLYLVLVLT